MLICIPYIYFGERGLSTKFFTYLFLRTYYNTTIILFMAFSDRCFKQRQLNAHSLLTTKSEFAAEFLDATHTQTNPISHGDCVCVVSCSPSPFSNAFLCLRFLPARLFLANMSPNLYCTSLVYTTCTPLVPVPVLHLAGVHPLYIPGTCTCAALP